MAEPAQPGPGLDVAQLLALRHPPHDRAAIITRIGQHLAEHDGYVALSGGKDSLVVLHMALAAEPAVPVAFFDSGCEFPETITYIASLAEQWNFADRLHWITARPNLLQALHDSAAWDHSRARPPVIPDLHRILIGEPSAQAHEAHGPGELWGVRSWEARGRRALYGRALRTEVARSCAGCCPPGPVAAAAQRARHGGIIRRADGTVAFGPVWDWKASDIWAYIARHRLPVNPVYAKLRRLRAPERALRVSAMIDGNALELGRVTWLRRGWPGLFNELAQVLPRLREFV